MIVRGARGGEGGLPRPGLHRGRRHAEAAVDAPRQGQQREVPGGEAGERVAEEVDGGLLLLLLLLLLLPLLLPHGVVNRRRRERQGLQGRLEGEEVEVLLEQIWPLLPAPTSRRRRHDVHIPGRLRHQGQEPATARGVRAGEQGLPRAVAALGVVGEEEDGPQGAAPGGGAIGGGESGVVVVLFLVAVLPVLAEEREEAVAPEGDAGRGAGVDDDLQESEEEEEK